MSATRRIRLGAAGSGRERLLDRFLTCMDRREFAGTCAAFAAASFAIPGSSPAAAEATSFDSVAQEVWAPPRPGGGLRDMVRLASLAANSHNTQPWRFRLEETHITIFPDLSRRCLAVDPDDHHLFASLGCATENLIHAASAAGLRATPATAPAGDDSIAIDLQKSVPISSALADAIVRRQCTRAEYDGRPIFSDDLKLLESVGQGRGVSCLVVTDRRRIEAVLEYVVQGNTVQMRDKAFMDELVGWIRFNEAAAIATRDGLFARSSGNPTLPSWIAKLILPFVFTEAHENDKYRRHIRSSPALAIFVSERNDKSHWIEAGRACQRLALQATALGLKHAFVNQPVEVPKIRDQLATFLALGDRRPDLVMRLGYGPELPRSLRRPVDQIIG